MPPLPAPSSSSFFFTRQLHGPHDSGAPPTAATMSSDAKALEAVLARLTSRADRNSASLVSKAWCAAEARTRSDVFVGNCYAVSPARVVKRFPNAKSFTLKGRPHFADFSLVPPGWGARLAPWLAAFAPAYPGLEKLWIKRMEITDEDLFAIARSFPSFKELVIVCCDGFSTHGLAAIAENCWELRVLDLVDDDVDDDGGVDWVSKFPEESTKLESLVFDCVESEVDFDELEALVARSPNLKRLKVNQFVDATQLPRLMVAAPNLTCLGTGSFQAPQGKDEDFLPPLVSAFSSSKSLVGLAGFRNVAPGYLPAIYPACANLTTLNFSYADITGKELKPVISHCHNLRVFWVLDSVRDEGLIAVAATCKILEELRVFPSVPKEDIDSPVSDVGLVAISEGCRKLRRILYFCQSMTNAAMITMSENCPDIAMFRLCIMERYRTDHATGEPMDEGFGAVVMNCKKLTRLSVSGLLTDKAFEYIGKFGKSLRTLSVAFAGDSDRGLTHVLQGCPELKKLEIRDCPFGDSALLSGLDHYYNMRFLWMSACSLSLKACQEVADKLPKLVVEVIKDTYSDSEEEHQDENCKDVVQKLYMYRSVAGPRADLPSFVQIL